MYKCGLCPAVTPAGQPLIRLTLYKPGANGKGRDVDREIPVCPECSTDLASGRTPAEIRDQFRTPAPPKFVVVVLAPPPPPAVPVILGRQARRA